MVMREQRRSGSETQQSRGIKHQKNRISEGRPSRLNIAKHFYSLPTAATGWVLFCFDGLEIE